MSVVLDPRAKPVVGARIADVFAHWSKTTASGAEEMFAKSPRERELQAISRP